jgi:hypothetical protein
MVVQVLGDGSEIGATHHGVVPTQEGRPMTAKMMRDTLDPIDEEVIVEHGIVEHGA